MYYINETKCYVPFSYSHSSHEKAWVPVLLAREVRLLVRELLNLRFEVDVRGVDDHIRIEFSRGEPGASEVAREVAGWLHILITIDYWNKCVYLESGYPRHSFG